MRIATTSARPATRAAQTPAYLDRHDDFDGVEGVQAKILKHDSRKDLRFVNLAQKQRRGSNAKPGKDCAAACRRCRPRRAHLFVVLHDHHDALGDVILRQERLRRKRVSACEFRPRHRATYRGWF